MIKAEKISRRDALKILGVTAVGNMLAACVPSTANIENSPCEEAPLPEHAPDDSILEENENTEAVIFQEESFPYVIKEVKLPLSDVEQAGIYHPKQLIEVEFNGQIFQIPMSPHVLGTAISTMWVMPKGLPGIEGGSPVLDFAKWQLFQEIANEKALPSKFSFDPENVPLFVVDTSSHDFETKLDSDFHRWYDIAWDELPPRGAIQTFVNRFADIEIVYLLNGQEYEVTDGTEEALNLEHKFENGDLIAADFDYYYQPTDITQLLKLYKVRINVLT